MKRLIIIAFSLFLVFVAACSGAQATPAPTVDIGAVQTQAALAVFATQTASVPTATNSPVATNTPTPINTPTLTNTPAQTDTPKPTDTPEPTDTPAPTDTPTNTSIPPSATRRPPTRTPLPPTAKAAPVLKDQTVKLNDQWDATLISVRRDKTLFGPFDNAETAFGVYATVLLRVKNNASGSDYIGNTFSFEVRPDGGAPIYYKLFNTLEDKAQYYYACCNTAFSTIAPGAEDVILMVFDVPEGTKNLSFYFTPSNPFERDVPTVGPEFFVPDFDQIPPRGAKP